MNNREFNATHITSSYYGISQVKFSQYVCICLTFHSESLCMNLWISLLVAEDPVFVSLPFGMTAANELRNGSCILPGNVSPGSDILSDGNWTKCFDWRAALKWKSWLAVAQPQENAGCLQTLSISPDTCTHWHKNDPFILFTFCFSGIMGVTA